MTGERTAPAADADRPGTASASAARPGIRGPLHLPVMGMAGIWLLYVAFPLIALFTTYPDPARRGIGLAILTVFAVVYLLGFGRSPHWAEGNRRDLLWLWTVLLTVLMIALYPLLFAIAFSLLTFVVASIAFPHPPRIALPVGGAVALVGTAAALLLAPEMPKPAVLGFTLAGSAFVLITAAMTARMEAEAELRHQLATAQDRERIARDVHDVLGHSLTVINLKAELASRLVAADPSAAQAEMQQVAELSREALAQARTTVMRGRESSLSEELAAAQRALTAAGVAVDAPDPSAAEPAAGRDADLFAAVLREAVTNTVRHAEASRCTITVAPGRLQVVDDGRGRGEAADGNGLRGLRRRVTEAGGRVTVESAPGEGTAVTVRMR
ncbi:sensor histidine kinase [Helcobacillus massiliensis]|uniref:sensor histidine kinase n=1 Tax=Helcobacillus massiliensis TaxID=521392 RepID=UPI002555BCD8|nr:histidine kinase [Helcobacillus massiliensis]MDK7741818.1 histidine kinase [Helcobacillus massiliensis]WOO92991.1 histidine kinase [Helcobacillus massiliensis]